MRTSHRELNPPNILLIRFQIMKKALEHFIRVLLAKLYQKDKLKFIVLLLVPLKELCRVPVLELRRF